MQDLMFFVPGLCGITLSIISYNGHLNVGIMIDKSIKVEAEDITTTFKNCFDELYKTVMDEKEGQHTDVKVYWTWIEMVKLMMMLIIFYKIHLLFPYCILSIG